MVSMLPLCLQSKLFFKEFKEWLLFFKEFKDISVFFKDLRQKIETLNLRQDPGSTPEKTENDILLDFIESL